jgi:Lon protease-like protein
VDDGPLVIPRHLPLLPLPDVVLFPGVVLPLEIIESRYRAMAADALAGARVIAVSLLRPGFEPYYYTLRAPVHRIAGVGQIVAGEKTQDGSYKLVLRGIARARILAELPHQPYRMARVQVLESREAIPAPKAANLRRELIEIISSERLEEEEHGRLWANMLETSVELGTVADLIAATLPVDAELRQCLLAELDTAERVSLLAQQLRTLAAVRRTRRTPSPHAEWTLN